MRLISRPTLGFLTCLLCSLSCLGQQRPLVTERAGTVKEGHFLFDVGVEFLQDAVFPFSGLKGDLTRAGVIGTRLGVGSRVEVQLFWTAHQFLNINQRFEGPGSGDLDFSGNSTSDFGNAALATKIRFTEGVQGRPIVAFRFGVELPNASTEKGLGTDETNAFFELLFEKRFTQVDLVGSAGLAILGDPLQGGSQDDLFTYGFAAIAEATPGLSVLGEINGRTGPSGIGNENQARIRAGIQFEAGGVVWDLAGFWGLEDTDPDSGIIVGLSKNFRLW